MSYELLSLRWTGSLMSASCIAALYNCILQQSRVESNHPPHTSLTLSVFTPFVLPFVFTLFAVCTCEGVRCGPRRLQRFPGGRHASVLQARRDQAPAVIDRHRHSRVTSRGA